MPFLAVTEKSANSLLNFSTKKIRHCLYHAAKNDGYNVLAVAQHLDDVCENFFMSLFHNGKLQAMKAHYYIRYKLFLFIFVDSFTQNNCLFVFLNYLQETQFTCDKTICLRSREGDPTFRSSDQRANLNELQWTGTVDEGTSTSKTVAGTTRNPLSEIVFKSARFSSFASRLPWSHSKKSTQVTDDKTWRWIWYRNWRGTTVGKWLNKNK